MYRPAFQSTKEPEAVLQGQCELGQSVLGSPGGLGEVKTSAEAVRRSLVTQNTQPGQSRANSARDLGRQTQTSSREHPTPTLTVFWNA